MAIKKDIITHLPLFIGLTDKELSEIADNTVFALHHHKKGSVIAQADSPCKELIILTNGDIETETVADDKSYRLTETLHAVHCIEPEKLFGMEQRFRTSYSAATACEALVIDQYLIVRLNYINMLCRKAQQTEHNPWKACPADLKQRVVKFVKDRVLYPAGSKKLYITMNRLSMELGCSRLEVSIALNQLAHQERIILKRGIIEIPALQLL